MHVQTHRSMPLGEVCTEPSYRGRAPLVWIRDRNHDMAIALEIEEARELHAKLGAILPAADELHRQFLADKPATAQPPTARTEA